MLSRSCKQKTFLSTLLALGLFAGGKLVIFIGKINLKIILIKHLGNFVVITLRQCPLRGLQKHCSKSSIRSLQVRRHRRRGLQEILAWPAPDDELALDLGGRHGLLHRRRGHLPRAGQDLHLHHSTHLRRSGLFRFILWHLSLMSDTSVTLISTLGYIGFGSGLR